MGAERPPFSIQAMVLYLHSVGYGYVTNGYLSTRLCYGLEPYGYRHVIGFGAAL